MRTACRNIHVNILCAGLLLAGILGLRAQPAAADIGPVSAVGHPIVYLGVVYFQNINDPNRPSDSAALDAIVQAFGGQTYFTGAAYDVQLVIESEIGWDATEPYAPDDPRHSFNFGAFQQFAELVRSKHLVWTPLLSYHYVPTWVSTKYSADAMPSAFMPFVPTSAVWSNEASTWTQQAMQALAPYFGDPIQVVLCGNEMTTAKRSTDSSYQAADFDARSQSWANALSTLVNAAKGVVQGRVPVSTKLVPYELHATEMLQHGMFPHAYDLLDSLDLVAIDAYPPTDIEYQALLRSAKAIYLSEFNDPAGQVASGADLLSWVELGVSRYNLRYAAWFCWDCHPGSAGGTDYSMTTDQQQGMRNAIGWVTGLSSVYSPPATSAAFQLSTDILSKSDSAWMVSADEESRHAAAFALPSKLAVPVRYEVDYRPRPADVHLQQVVDAESAATFGQPGLYLLEEPAAQVAAPEGTFFTSAGSCCSEGKIAYSPSLAAGTQVFDWTPWWNLGVRKLEKQQLSSTLGAVRDWVVSPDGVPVAEQFGSSFFVAQGTLWELSYHPERPLPTLLGDMINTAAAGTGSPFLYASVRDESLACNGIAGYSSASCQGIADFNDRQMCSALATRTQTACTQMTDRNLQLACYGMALAPSYPSNCRDITDANLQRFCYGVAGYDTSQCAALADPNTRQLCDAMATNNSGYCGSITTANGRQLCYGLSAHTSSYCAGIQ
jgi:hypothetical protein